MIGILIETAMGAWMLMNVTGALSNVVGIVRNIVSSRVSFSIRWKLLFIAIQGILTIVVNKAGLLGWLPFIAAAAFTWFLDTRNERVLKGAIIFGELLWIVYDLSNRNFAGLVFDVITVFSNIAGIILITRDIRLADRRAISLASLMLQRNDKAAVIFGNESTGLPGDIINASDNVVKIPMQNGVDSLNVAAASAVVFWELNKGI